MGSFLIRSNIDNAKKEVIHFLENYYIENLECNAEESTESGIKINAQAQIENIRVNISSDVYQYDDSSLIKLIIHPVRAIQIQVGLKAILTIILTLLIIFSKSISSLSLSVKLKDIIIIGIFYLVAFNFLRDLRTYGRQLRLIETRFLAFMRANNEAKILSPIEDEIFPLWFSTLITLGGWLCVLLFCSIALKGMLIIIVAYAFLNIVHLILRSVAQNSFVLFWKMKLIELNYKWLLTSIYIIAFFAFLYVCNAAFVVNYLKAEKHLNYSLKEALTTIYFKPAFERQTKDYPKENAEIVKKSVEKGVAGDKVSKELSYKICIVLGAILFLIGIFGLLWTILKKYKEILNIPEQWKTVVGEQKIGHIKQPAAVDFRPKIMKATKALIVMDYIAALPINYFAAIIGIDALSYALMGKTIVIEKAAILFSWIPADIILLFDTINVKKYVPISFEQMLFVTKIVLILISLPVILILFRRICNIFKNISLNIFGMLYSFCFRHSVPFTFKDTVRRVSNLYKIAKPRVRIIKSKMIKVSIRSGMVLRTPILLVSKRALEELDESEFAAIVAHEMGHIKQGLGKISLAKIISSVSLFPNNFLVLLFDFPEMEYYADKLCVEITKDKISLKKALIKISTINYTNGVLGKTHSNLFAKYWSKKPFIKIKERLKQLSFADEFFFGDVLLGYSYPTIMQRLKNIDSL